MFVHSNFVRTRSFKKFISFNFAGFSGIMGENYKNIFLFSIKLKYLKA